MRVAAGGRSATEESCCPTSRARIFREDSADSFIGDLGDPSQGNLWHLGDPRDDASMAPLSGVLDEPAQSWS